MINFLYYLLIFVEVICSFLLIGVILLQRSKSSGLGGLAVGAGMGESLFGPRAGNILTRATVVLAIIFLLNTTILALLGPRRQESSIADTISTRPPAGATAPAPMTSPSTAEPQPARPTEVEIPIPADSSGTAPNPTPAPTTESTP